MRSPFLIPLIVFLSGCGGETYEHVQYDRGPKVATRTLDLGKIDRAERPDSMPLGECKPEEVLEFRGTVEKAEGPTGAMLTTIVTTRPDGREVIAASKLSKLVAEGDGQRYSAIIRMPRKAGRYDLKISHLDPSTPTQPPPILRLPITIR